MLLLEAQNLLQLDGQVLNPHKMKFPSNLKFVKKKWKKRKTLVKWAPDVKQGDDLMASGEETPDVWGVRSGCQGSIPHLVYGLINNILPKYLLLNIMVRWGQTFALAMIIDLLWYVHICDMIGSLCLPLEQAMFLHDLNYEAINQLWNSSMMTSSNGNIFCVTGRLCGEFTVHRWNPHTKASDAELWCFLWSEPE